MNVTFYKRPNGTTEELTIENVYPEDKEFFTENDISVSIEQVDNQFILYADCGETTPEGESKEQIVFSGGMSCEDSLKKLRDLCEAYLHSLGDNDDNYLS